MITFIIYNIKIYLIDGDLMDNEEIINLDDINYAIYKIGDWSNHYEINQIGLSREIPVTKNTVSHVKISMEEIRNTKFDMQDKSINGFVLFALQLNPNVQKMELDDVIALEEPNIKIF